VVAITSTNTRGGPSEGGVYKGQLPAKIRGVAYVDFLIFVRYSQGKTLISVEAVDGFVGKLSWAIVDLKITTRSFRLIGSRKRGKSGNLFFNNESPEGDIWRAKGAKNREGLRRGPLRGWWKLVAVLTLPDTDEAR